MLPAGAQLLSKAVFGWSGEIKWEYKNTLKSMSYMYLILFVILYLFDFIAIFCWVETQVLFHCDGEGHRLAIAQYIEFDHCAGFALGYDVHGGADAI